MTSSVEEAILLLKRWQSNSSKLRIVWGSDHSRMAFQGKVWKIDDSSLWCIGADIGTELHFNVEDAAKIDFRDERGIPEDFPDIAQDTELFLSILWPDNSRLSVVEEKQALSPSTHI